MFRQMKIKTRIVGILAQLGGGYLLLLLMVQLAAISTHNRMSQISTSLFPAALRMQEAEAAFERMKKHYGDAVVLQDASALASARKGCRGHCEALYQVKEALAVSAGVGQSRLTICSPSFLRFGHAITTPMRQSWAPQTGPATN